MATHSELPLSTIYQFSNPTWLENLAIRSNGDILTTLLTSPELYLIKPASHTSATLVHKFDDGYALTGIIETKHDVFYVAGGKFNLSTFTSEPSSWVIWEVDMTSFDECSKANIKLFTLPDASFLNGLELLCERKGFILGADSIAGAVWKVDVNTGAHGIAIQLPDMKPAEGDSPPLGINGIKIRDKYLYWTNSAARTLFRVKIDDDVNAIGPVETIATKILADDFTFDKSGNAWLTTAFENTVVVLKVDGSLMTVAGAKDQLIVAGPTSCQFGKNGAEDILYVATSGAIASPVNGTETEGGKIVAIDTSNF